VILAITPISRLRAVERERRICAVLSDLDLEAPASREFEVFTVSRREIGTAVVSVHPIIVVAHVV